MNPLVNAIESLRRTLCRTNPTYTLPVAYLLPLAALPCLLIDPKAEKTGNIDPLRPGVLRYLRKREELWTKTTMAKLTSILTFNGALEGLSAYRMKGVKDPIVRARRGPAKEAFYTGAQYDKTRRNLSENRGRNKAVSLLMKAFQPLKLLADFDTAGQLNKLLRAVQKGDTESPLGQRAVRSSRFAQLLEGFNLTKAAPFDALVHGEAHTQISRAPLEASVVLPELLPHLTFFPPSGYPYCRLVATLGVAPDMVSGPLGWGTDGDFSNCYTVATETEWFAAAKGYGATTLSLALPYTPPTEAFALVLTVAMQLGEPSLTGGVEPVRKRIGSAKILAAV